jgi:hypothetical protein
MASNLSRTEVSDSATTWSKVTAARKKHWSHRII